MYKEFQLNPLLKSMQYAAEELVIIYYRKKGGTETRHYIGVPKETVYAWFYKQTLKESLSYYAKNIRKKFTLIKKTQTNL